MQRRHLKAVFSLLIVLITAWVFVYYFRHHPGLITELKKTEASVLVILFVLYFLFTGSIALILHASLRLCDASVRRRETALVTMYSAIINFFGPLQSGPAFRAAYLKKKHNVSLKSYGAASLMYYAIYAVINVVLLFSSVTPWWAMLITLTALATGVWLLRRRAPERFIKLRLGAVGYLGLATCLQISLITAIFFIELHSIDSSVTIAQACVYAGAANLALFVSITPGAIGFRESFLYLSQQLHGVQTPTIVAANVLDRSLYISMLLLIAVYIFTTSARRNLLEITSK